MDHFENRFTLSLRRVFTSIKVYFTSSTCYCYLKFPGMFLVAGWNSGQAICSIAPNALNNLNTVEKDVCPHTGLCVTFVGVFNNVNMLPDGQVVAILPFMPFKYV